MGDETPPRYFQLPLFSILLAVQEEKKLYTVHIFNTVPGKNNSIYTRLYNTN
jgi:hypothetical protein